MKKRLEAEIKERKATMIRLSNATQEIMQANKEKEEPEVELEKN